MISHHLLRLLEELPQAQFVTLTKRGGPALFCLERRGDQFLDHSPRTAQTLVSNFSHTLKFIEDTQELIGPLHEIQLTFEKYSWMIYSIDVHYILGIKLIEMPPSSVVSTRAQRAVEALSLLFDTSASSPPLATS
jgi:hypothetical protein